MRPQQQNRRMRGRNNGGGNNNNNNNRKGANPLNRNYESNGPDVKIRGSAQQIAEKYATLARDAQSSGDRVMAENYLQHAEHYNRIIAAAQAQMPVQQAQNRNDDFDDDGDDDRDDFDNNTNSGAANNEANGEGQAPVVNHGAGPQPVIAGTPAEIALNAEGGSNGNRGNNGNGRHRERRPGGGYGQNGQRTDHGSRGEQRDGAVQEKPTETVSPAPQEASPQPEDLSPAGLAARAERNEQAGRSESAGMPDEAPAAPRVRKPRRPRVAKSADAAQDASPDPATGGAGNETVSVED